MLTALSSDRTWLAVLLLSCLALPVAAETVDHAPVLLYSSLLLPPIESTGTGLAPEVKVRVSVDERGQVTEVEVLSIKPASEYDDVFRRDTIEQLLQWRYSPAIVEGEPAATKLEWTVQFQARSNTVGSSSSSGLLPPILSLQADAEARHARIMSLPLEKKKEILLTYSGIAEKHINRKHRQQFDTEHFVVVTDAESADAARIVAHNLDVSLGFIHRVVQPHIQPQPTRLKILVYLYAKRSSFDTMRADLLPYTCETATYYAPGLITYYLEVPSADFLLSLLIHEATHAYSDHHLRRPGLPLPRWFEEGFAEYMGNSQVKKGQLIPGRTLKRHYVLNHFVPGATLRNTEAGGDLERVKLAVRRGEGLTLEEMSTADRDVFYGDKWQLYYGVAWLFVHFLRHGEPSWAEESFPLLMLYMAEGYPAKAALELAYGTTFAELEAPFQRYVKKF